MQNLSARIDEPASLTIRLDIEDGYDVDTEMRFCVVGGPADLVFKAERQGEDPLFLVSLPAMEQWLKPGNYTGVAEVFIKERFFNPLHVSLRFTAKPAVEATLVGHGEDVSDLQEDLASTDDSQEDHQDSGAEAKQSNIEEEFNPRSLLSRVQGNIRRAQGSRF